MENRTYGVEMHPSLVIGLEVPEAPPAPLGRCPRCLVWSLGRGSGFGRSLRLLRPVVQLAAGDDHLVDLVWAVGDLEHAGKAPHPRERRVVGHAERSVNLDRAVEHV